MATKSTKQTPEQILHKAAGLSVDVSDKTPIAVKEKMAGKSFDEALQLAHENEVEELSINFQGQKFKVKLHRIPHADIEKLTEVHEENARFQHWLTDYAIDELMTNMIENEQHVPALGFNCKSKNKILIIDGSCRRASAIKGGLDYYVYVSENELDPKMVNSLSINTNINVTQSIVEYGEIHLASMEALGHTAYEHSIHINEQKETIRRRVNSALFYREYPFLIDSFPAPSQLGWPTFNYLIKKVPTLSDEDLELLSISLPTKTILKTNSNLVNKLHLEKLKKLIESIKGESKERAKKLEFKSFEISDGKNNYGNAKLNNNGGVTINLPKNSKDARSALMKLLKSIK